MNMREGTARELREALSTCVQTHDNWRHNSDMKEATAAWTDSVEKARQILAKYATSPCIQRIFDCSTGHVKKADMEALEADSCPICAYSYEYGAFVHISKDDPGEKYPGLSDAFHHLLSVARKYRCDFLRLDCDGTQYDWLPWFDWQRRET